MSESGFSLELTLREGYEFDVDFEMPGVEDVLVDEPAPLGRSNGPNAARLLGAAIGNCLAASLLFCLRKSRVEVAGMKVEVDGTLVRNERGRLRIGTIAVRLAPTVADDDRARVSRCLELFEDFCIVTGSVREGVDVDVEVLPVSPAEREVAGVPELV